MSLRPLLVIISALLLLFILGGAGYFFYSQGRPQLVPQVDKTREFSVSGLYGKNVIREDKIQYYRNKFQGISASFFSRSVIKTLLVGFPVELTKKEDGGMTIVLNNTAGDTTTLNFTPDEVSIMRIYVVDTADEAIRDVDLLELRQNYYLTVIYEISLLDERPQFTFISVEGRILPPSNEIPEP